jgi:hypothetical protein
MLLKDIYRGIVSRLLNTALFARLPTYKSGG